jgi:hypothetical protein
VPNFLIAATVAGGICKMDGITARFSNDYNYRNVLLKNLNYRWRGGGGARLRSRLSKRATSAQSQNQNQA